MEVPPAKLPSRGRHCRRVPSVGVRRGGRWADAQPQEESGQGRKVEGMVVSCRGGVLVNEFKAQNLTLESIN